MDFNDKIARASLHVEVADRVREMIFDGTLSAGFRIDELDLSAKLGTSRTPLREALKVLANEGLVRLAPGRGAFVSELIGPEVDSLFPVLALLEGRCVAEAVQRIERAEVARLDGIQQRMERHAAAGDAVAFDAATDEFHQALHAVAGNPWLEKVTGELRSFLRLARGQSHFADGRLLQTLAEHRTLLRSIDRGDGDGAEQVMNHHLFAQQRAWRQWLAASNLHPESATPGGRAAADEFTGASNAAPVTGGGAQHSVPVAMTTGASRVPAATITSDSESIGV
ncbi:MAG: GntR family transcriptional regulator [Burkholderiaceae bacterium]